MICSITPLCVFIINQSNGSCISSTSSFSIIVLNINPSAVVSCKNNAVLCAIINIICRQHCWL
ncbi:MAG: DUF126 domain-containing protein [Clostridia bacterium]|nr:DUF126 domain-containing protein [Clostridia bacterium]